MADPDFSKPWYFGSPFVVDSIRPGSTITQDRDVARILSHKPALLSVSKNGGIARIKHNGELPGRLYQIAEPVGPGDVKSHPTSALKKGEEWLTTKELRVELIAPTQLMQEELLSAKEVEALLGKPQPNGKQARGAPA